MAHLSPLGPRTRSAPLLHSTTPSSSPITAHALPDARIWFIFPEPARGPEDPAPKTLTEPRTEEGICQAFRDQFFIDVPEELSTLRDLRTAVDRQEGKTVKEVQGHGIPRGLPPSFTSLFHYDYGEE